MPPYLVFREHFFALTLMIALGHLGNLPKVTQVMSRAGISTHLHTVTTHVSTHTAVSGPGWPCSNGKEQGTQVNQESLVASYYHCVCGHTHPSTPAGFSWHSSSGGKWSSSSCEDILCSWVILDKILDSPGHIQLPFSSSHPFYR